MKYLRDIDGVTHSEGAAGEFTLCGLAPEGERGDEYMVEVAGPIDCKNCIGIIRHCKSLKKYQINTARFKYET